MKETTLMQLPLSLRLIFNSSIIGFLLMLISFLSLANESNIAVKTGISFYNNVDDSNRTSESLSNSFVLGAQMPILENLSVSLDGSTGSSAYIGTSLDYETKVSDDFNLFGRVGVDFLSNEVIPKLSGGIEAVVNDTLGLTMETILRNADNVSDYQFVVGVKYKFRRGFFELDELDELDELEQFDETAIKEVVVQKINHEIIHGENNLKNSYKVIKGDTFWGIARKHKLDPNELINRNIGHIRNPDLIYPGDVILF